MNKNFVITCSTPCDMSQYYLRKHEMYYVGFYYYLNDEKFMDDFFTTHSVDEFYNKIKGKYHIQRSKGLGENEPEMMRLTTMSPQTRRLIQVMPEDIEKTQQIFELLLGDNLQGRKDHIKENGYKYIDLTELG